MYGKNKSSIREIVKKEKEMCARPLSRLGLRELWPRCVRSASLRRSGIPFAAVTNDREPVA